MITIGDYKATFEKIDDGKGNDLYSADITIKDNETDLEEGKISFTISDYQDLAGNEGKEVTEDSVKTNIIYDRTAPEKVALKINSSYKNKEYGKVGDSFGVYLTVDEELAQDPTFTVNGKEYKANQHEKVNSGYKYAVVYTITDDMEEGPVSFTISNIVDKAGNKLADLSNVDTNETLTIDKTKSVIEIGGTTGSKYWKQEQTVPVKITEVNLEDVYYVVNSSRSDSSIYELDSDKAIKVDSKDIINNGDGTYTFNVKLDKDGRFVINVKAIDKAGNATYHRNGWYQIDKTAPKISIGGSTGGKNWHREQTFDVTITDASLDSVYYAWNKSSNDKNMHNLLDSDKAIKVDSKDIINNGDGTYTVKITIATEGRYVFNVKAVDKAGNVTYKRKGWYQIDRTNPVISLHKNQNEDSIVPGLHNYSVSATVDEDHLKSLKLNGKDYKSGSYINEEGEYTLVAVDYAGNKDEIKFEIDKTKPIISINGVDYSGVNNKKFILNKFEDFEIIDKNGYTVRELTRNGEKISLDENTFKVDGDYKIHIKDNALNDTVIEFTLDRIPVGFVELKVNSNQKNKNYAKVGDFVGVYLKVNEELKEVPTFVINGEEFTGRKDEWEGIYTYSALFKVTDDTKEGKVEFAISNIYDKAGNPLHDINGNVLETVTNANTNEYVIIDKTAPTATIVYSNDGSDKLVKSVTATLTANEEVKVVESGTWNSLDNYVTVSKKVIYQNGEQTVIIEDRAGNRSEFTINIKNIDREAPSIGDLESGKIYYEKIPYEMSDNSGSFKLYYDYGHNFQTCEELMEKGSTMGIIQGTYKDEFVIPMDADGVSVCLVDEAGNTTFRNNISIRVNKE